MERSREIYVYGCAFVYLSNLNKIQRLSKLFTGNVNYSQINFDVN